jgi:hypothetical protein
VIARPPGPGSSFSTSVIETLNEIRAWQVFLLAFALRLIVISLRPSEWVRTENLRAGFTLATKGYLGDPFSIPTGLTAHVSPAYPALVAAVRLITGDDDASVRALAVLLAVVTSLNIAALIPAATVLRLPRGAGVIAAGLWIVPLFAWIELSAEHETPLTVSALLALVTIIVRIVSSASPSWIRHGLLLGLATGLAAYCTPTAVLVASFTVAAGVAVVRWPVRRVLAVGFVAAVAFTGAIAPYTIRNHRAFGEWFFMRDNFGMELAISNGDRARAPAEENSDPVTGTLRAHPFISRAEAASVRDLGEVAYNHRLRDQAVAWIRGNPQAFVRLTARRAGYLVLPHAKRERWYQRVVAGAVSVLFLFGSVRLWNAPYSLGVRCVVAAIISQGLVYLLIEHDIRYAYPMLFLESLVSAALLLWWWSGSGRAGTADGPVTRSAP